MQGTLARVSEVQESPHLLREVQEVPHSALEVSEVQESPRLLREVQEMPHSAQEGSERPHAGEVTQHRVRRSILTLSVLARFSKILSRK